MLENYKNIKVVAFDLDGTLTQHKEKLTKENKAVLDKLSEKYKLLMVGAGQCERIYKQLNCYPIDIIGNYGLQWSKIDEKGNFKLIKDLILACDKESIDKRVSLLRQKYGYTDFAGENVEFHPSGCVTIPLLGTKAQQKDKLSFDPDRKKRRKIYADVCSLFDDYTVFVGGSSSFDMVPAPYDKCYALNEYAKLNDLAYDQIVYIGDDYGLGGNDESIFKSQYKTIKIDNYLDLEKVVSVLF